MASFLLHTFQHLIACLVPSVSSHLGSAGCLAHTGFPKESLSDPSSHQQQESSLQCFLSEDHTFDHHRNPWFFQFYRASCQKYMVSWLGLFLTQVITGSHLSPGPSMLPKARHISLERVTVLLSSCCDEAP